MLGEALGNEGRSQPVKRGVLGRRSGENGMQAPEPLRPDLRNEPTLHTFPPPRKKALHLLPQCNQSILINQSQLH